LVLVGGGHAHVAVLKSFGMKPMTGVRITLISDRPVTPYSGMLPGLIAGHYPPAAAHIELRPLCHFAQARFFRSTLTGLDLEQRLARCDNRPPVSFDLVSIDTGSTPATAGVPGADQHALAIKPVHRFMERWEQITEAAADRREGPLRIVVVGGGAGGVELILSVRQRLVHKEPGPVPRHPRTPDVEFHLISDAPVLLPTHNRRVQAIFTRIFRERAIHAHLGQRAVTVEADAVHCDSGRSVPYDALIWVTTAAAPPWIAESGLATDAAGFLLVNDCLRSCSHPFVLAAGDVAAVRNHPRPKSGVFAVRQGPPLALNLRRLLGGREPRPFTPQRQALSLISTGDQRAVASRGPLALEGAWLWRVKDWIDRRWMRQYRELPEMHPSGFFAQANSLASTHAP
jgi:selenide,water dikinase